MKDAAPKVFISYSHDTVEHQERVLGLADRLRADGIDAEVDQYNAAPPEGWPLWCERQIAAADVVLMVCTETYYRRVSGDEEQGKGLGRRLGSADHPPAPLRCGGGQRQVRAGAFFRYLV